MADSTTAARWRPTRTHLVAGGLVLAGFVLMNLSWWFLLLVGLGSFGPGALRELGWLDDKDELQREADRRAGYHAFLITGLLACALVAFFRSGVREVRNPEELATLFFALLWCVWIFSSLLGYWGAQKTASRILVGFGCAWFAFTVISNLGSEWSGWAALLLHPLLTLPFFAMAWTARRWPRLTGVVLVAAAAWFVHFFGLFQRGERSVIDEGLTFLLFVGPLLPSGVALLAARPDTLGDLAD